MRPPEEPVLVDSRGRLCPQPVIDAARVARGLPVGTLLEVLATDPAAALDLPAWARMRGHELVSVDPDPAHRTTPTREQPVRVVVRLG